MQLRNLKSHDKHCQNNLFYITLSLEMNIIEFLSPIFRQKFNFIFLSILIGAVFFGGFQMIPSIGKTTVYFPVKPLEPTEGVSVSVFDEAESTSKIAEMIAGWAKDPGFRQEVLTNAGVSIDNFKRKLSARKQNRMNVFWTITLYGKEIEKSERLTEALITTFNKNFEEFNKNRAIQYGINTPSIFREMVVIPFSWLFCAAVFLGLFIATLWIYIAESFGNKASFINQIKKIFYKSPMLRISKKLGTHDEKLLEQFILTFESPRLIGVFAEAEKYFSLPSQEIIDISQDTPILLVKLGETTLHDLENLEAIYGRVVGVVIFEK